MLRLNAMKENITMIILTVAKGKAKVCSLIFRHTGLDMDIFMLMSSRIAS